MAKSPYIEWYTSDFLNGVAAADMSAEQIGVYAIILTLIADTGAPIEDDAAWIGRRCNISTRRAGAILTELAAMPNKIRRRNGLIGNTRMMKEVAKRTSKSQSARDAANIKWERWRDEHKPQLPFPDEPGNGPKKTQKPRKAAPPASANASPVENAEPEPGSPVFLAEKPEKKREINSALNSEKPQTSADPEMRTHFGLARAGVNPESDSIQTNESLEFEVETPNADQRPVDRSPDLLEHLSIVCRAAGYVPTTVAAQSRAIDVVKGWRDTGIPFDTIVVPTIQRTIEKSDDPTSSLVRFDKAVRHEHARSGAQPSRPSLPAGKPILEPENEDPQFQPLRTALLGALGPQAFCAAINPIRFSPIKAVDAEVRPLGINGPPFRIEPLLHGIHAATLLKIARGAGFTTVWQASTRKDSP